MVTKTMASSYSSYGGGGGRYSSYSSGSGYSAGSSSYSAGKYSSGKYSSGSYSSGKYSSGSYSAGRYGKDSSSRSYSSGRYDNEFSSPAPRRSASVDRDVGLSSLRASESYFNRSAAPRRSRRDEEDDGDDGGDGDVLSRVRRKLRQRRAYSLDRDVGQDSEAFKVVRKQEQRFTSVIDQQKKREKLGQRIDEIYNTKYTRPSRSFSVDRESTRLSSRYDRDGGSRFSVDRDVGSRYSVDRDVGSRYSVDKDVGSRYSVDREAGRSRYSIDREVGSSYAADQDYGSRYSVDRDVGSRYSVEREGGRSRFSVERESGSRLELSSRYSTDREVGVRVEREGRSRLGVDRERRHRSLSRYTTDRDVSAVSRYQSLAQLEHDRMSGRDISSMVLDPATSFAPDEIKVTDLGDGRRATTYQQTSQRGTYKSKLEADREIDKVVEKTQQMKENMYTLEKFVRRNRLLFPEDTQVQQRMKFYQLSEEELEKIGEPADAVIYGVKIKERLVVPVGCDVTSALKKYYSTQGSSEVDVTRKGSSRVEIERPDDEEELTEAQRTAAIRQQVEKEFDAREHRRLLGDERLEVKEADRAVEQRDRYDHMHSHVTPEYIRSIYMNAGLDYDSIYEISRSRRSSMGSVQSDAESVCTRTTRASSTASSSRRRRLDTAPTYTAKLRPKRCHEGQTVRFNASVTANPMPDVSWFKGNRLITEGGRFHVSNNYGLLSLEISKVKRDDAGVYTVKAHNLEGEAACSAPLDVQEIETKQEQKDGQKKPWFVAEAQNTWAEVGGRATIEAQANGAPVPHFRWQRDNINVHEDGRVRIFTDEVGHVKLVIKNVAHTDAGLYFCIAENKSGKSKCAATLRVVDKGQLGDSRRSREPTPVRRGSMSRETTPLATPPAPLPARTPLPSGNEPWFVQKPPSTLNCHVGDVLTLKANIGGDPKPRVTWLKEPHRELTYSKRHRVVASGDHHMMEITSTVSTDAGRFICLVENSCGRAAAATFVNMLPPRQPEDDDLEARAHLVKLPDYDYELEITKEKGKMAPYFTRRLPVSKEVDAGSTLEVKCKVKEGDTPEITTGVDVKRTVSGEASIKTFTIGKGGVQKSVTETPLSAPKGDAKPEEAPVVPEAETPAQSAPAPEAAPAGAAPAFEKALEDKTGKVGKAVKLAVKVSGQPAPEVTFSKDGALMEEEGDTYDIVSKGCEHGVEFCDLEAADAAIYSCIAANATGSVSCSCRLTVLEKEEKKTAPTFVSKPADRDVKEGDVASLVATVTGLPQPGLSWTKDGVEISSNDHVTITQEDNKSTLTISKVDKSDEAGYTVTAKNTAGSSSATAKLTVTASEADSSEESTASEESADEASSEASDSTAKASEESESEASESEASEEASDEASSAATEEASEKGAGESAKETESEEESDSETATEGSEDESDTETLSESD